VPVLRGESGELRGLLPLVITRSGRPRICRIGGTSLGDLFHPVAEVRDEREVAAVIAEALERSPEPWSLLYLDNVKPGDWVRDLAAATGLRLRERDRASLPRIELGSYSSFDEYLASRSQNLRQRAKREQRRLAKKGVRARRTLAAEELDADFDAFLRLHDLRWSGRGDSSLAGERPRAFHREFAAEALRRGWLRLWFLETDAGPIASWYGWLIGGSYAYYNAGFDPAWAKHSPGVAMMAGVISAAFDEGAERFDLLLGEEAYKLRFSDSEGEVATFALAAPHSPASLVAGTDIAVRSVGNRLPGRRSGIARALARRLPGARQP
jgi:CelD/BcsL family acetyltransferase involved in cellulose biosynthesis